MAVLVRQSLHSQVPSVKPGLDPLAVARKILDPTCTLPTNARVVALALLRHADENGLCWPSYERLAACTGLSRRTCIDAVRTLLHATDCPVEIRVAKRRRDDGSQTSNLYGIRHRDPVESSEPHPAQKHADPSRQQVVQEPHRGSAARAPELPREQTKHRAPAPRPVVQRPHQLRGPGLAKVKAQYAYRETRHAVARPSAPSSSVSSLTSPNTDSHPRTKRIGHDDRLFLPRALSDDDREAAKDAIAGFLRSMRAA